MDENNILEVKGLKKFFPNRKGFFNRISSFNKAVNDVSLHIKKGETVGLVGESGSGKTTVGRCIVKLFAPTAGSIQYNFNGKILDISETPEHQIKDFRKNFQMLFQDVYSSLDPKMKVLEIVTEPLAIHSIGTQKERFNKACELITKVGLSPDDLQKYPHQFSGGQRQRIGITRALCSQPKFIVCDEPVSALDVSVQAQILNLLLDLRKDFNLSYLFIAHDLGVVKYFSDRIIVMYLGKIVEVALAKDIYASPKHPYTEALLAAISKYKVGSERKILLQGSIPDPSNPPTGCVLQPRCKYALDVCKQKVPALLPVPNKNDSFVACHRSSELNLESYSSK
ncbi:MAG: ATP-binding cassette domain-containing protein [Deltaproteobacteria bacterium]|jgi:oligopeptide/dipeptide ABC transporter ATP-binding protein|nr:ATP-binding cassette domain-containing protein [Deltaproteobacteria bacterium]